jgi:hypothetical protein
MGLYPKQSDYRDYKFPSEHYANRIYHVDSVNGDDTYSGLSWVKAKQTIMAAVNLARYLPGTTTIDDTKDHKTLVLIAPGHYNGEDIWFSGYGITLEGACHGRPGRDYGVSINYDGAQDTNAVIAFGGAGITLRNLTITCEEAIPGIWISSGDNHLIENCLIIGDNTNMTFGIDANSLKGSSIIGCDISGFMTAGIRGDGYCIQGLIRDNRIFGKQAVPGILVDNTATGWNFAIDRNFVDVHGGGAAAIGIDVNTTDTILVTDNFVLCHTTPITCAGNGSIGNHASINGAVTDPWDDNDG